MTDPTDPDGSDDPPRETTPGRGQGNGELLENRLAETLESWGYLTAHREQLLELTADVVAKRKPYRQEPTDYLSKERIPPFTALTRADLVRTSERFAF